MPEDELVEDFYGYVYITENLINGMKYIGQHKSKTFDKSYYGSGVRFSNAFKKYGRKNFSVRVLEWCRSLEELNAKEAYWVTYYDAVLDDSFYNLSEGGKGTRYPCKELNPRFGKKDSEETKRKKSNSLMGHEVTKETRDKLSKFFKGKSFITEEGRKSISEKSRARKHTPEEIEKMKLSHVGKLNPAKRPDVRARMNKDKRRKIQCIESGIIYESVSIAADSLGLSCSANIAHSAREFLKGHSVRGNGYHWRYV